MAQKHWTDEISDPTWEHIKRLRAESEDTLRRLDIERKRAEASERRWKEEQEKVLHWRGLYERTHAELSRLKPVGDAKG